MSIKKTKFFRILTTLLIFLILPVGVFSVQKAVKYFSQASFLPASLVVDMQSLGGVSTDVWRNLAQGGEEKGASLNPVVSQVKGLRPEYIRIDHIFEQFHTSIN